MSTKIVITKNSKHTERCYVTESRLRLDFTDTRLRHFTTVEFRPIEFPDTGVSLIYALVVVVKINTKILEKILVDVPGGGIKEFKNLERGMVYALNLSSIRKITINPMQSVLSTRLH